MAYRATVIPVMIASPGDVAEERAIIRSVIHDWNDVNAESSQVILSPVGWETHASPELGARAQELINARLLVDCDLLVGVFWTRLGTPTGQAQSGTVEEIERHLASGKPAMIYFSSRPAAPESIDPAQFGEVQAFKARCKELGLIEFFDDARGFKEKFARQLQLCLRHNEYLQRTVQELAAAPSSATAPAAPQSEYRPSEDARRLLQAAAHGNDGLIIKTNYMGGQTIEAGDETFEGDRREIARWEHALNELVVHGLVKAPGEKGEVYQLTHLGWTVADALDA